MSTAPPATNHALAEFEEFMNTEKWGRGWVLLDRRPDLIRYERSVPADGASCLVAAILLLLGVIPGLIYLAFPRRPARNLRLTVALRSDGTLAPTGDPEAIAKFEQFLDPKKTDKLAVRQMRTNIVIIVITVVVLVWLSTLING